MEHDAKLSAAVSGITEMTSTIVAAYVGGNHVQASDLPGIIKTVHAALSQLGQPEMKVEEQRQAPAVPVRKSITADFIVCLEDGKKLKMLKRYLRTTYRMTPEEYRAKWGLPADYPMVAPNYAARRSEFAKQIGLGRTSGGAASDPATAQAA